MQKDSSCAFLFLSRRRVYGLSGGRKRNNKPVSLIHEVLLKLLILIPMVNVIKIFFFVFLLFLFQKKWLRPRRSRRLKSKINLIILVLIFFSPSSEARIRDLWGSPVGESYSYLRFSFPPLVTFRSTHSSKTLKLRKEAYRSFLALKQKAAQQKVDLSILYAYRTLSTQQQLYKRLGRNQAEKVGYSEHHLGTAIDLVGVTASSEAFLWLLKYGIPRGWVPSYYYRRNSHFIKEPWHWRYVGRTAAKKFYLLWKSALDKDIQNLQNLQKKGKLKKRLP